jgi:hypothetical protein
MTILEILDLIREGLMTVDQLYAIFSNTAEGEVTMADIEAFRLADDEARKREEDAIKKAEEERDGGL